MSNQQCDTMDDTTFLPAACDEDGAGPSNGGFDALTGLLSHSCFQDIFRDNFNKARQEKTRLAFVLLNIDYFHAINRRFGYRFGDFVLKEIAGLLREFGPNDCQVSRFGGEEFSLTWFTNETCDAIDDTEKIRRCIADHHFITGGQAAYLTVSLGLAVSDARTRSAPELMASGKLVLRTAKRDGRNRICYWTRPEVSSPSMPEQDNDVITELQKKFTDLERDMNAYSHAEVRTLLDTLEIPDGLNNDHAENVAFLAASIADEIGIVEQDIDVIISAALLHDIGKVGIDKDILTKDSALTPNEFEQIKKHPLLGVEFLNDAKFFEKELPMILHHHEKYDGRGYPEGLSGEDIPLGARIIGIAETLDGLLSGTTYREPSSTKDVISELRRCAGGQFDPKLVEVAVKLLENGRIG